MTGSARTLREAVRRLVQHPFSEATDSPAPPFVEAQTVFGLVPADAAVAATREAFVRHARGEWSMPAKVYLSPTGEGDFRAMPATGDGIAMLKWVSSIPQNARRDLPTVDAIVIVNDAVTGELICLLDGQSVTSLRTGASAAVATQALASQEATTVGVIGCGPNGAWAARCLAAVGYGKGVVADLDESRSRTLADELGWSAGTSQEALACDIVTTVTPGHQPVIGVGDLRPGMHINALGADGPGKQELTVEALTRCELYCDEWEQASHGGELTAAVERGLVQRDGVGEIGRVLTKEHAGRTDPTATTLFDSTGLAIQDLAIVVAFMESVGGEIGA